MTAIRINPMVVSVSPTGTSQIHRINPTQHGGGVKKIIAVAAAVVIPIAAPAIASSIAASGVLGAAVSSAMVTTAGAAVSSAIVGAGLGAITAKVTGGDVKTGAIMGGLGGALAGYGSAAKGTFGTPAGGIKATADRVLGTNFSGTSGLAEGQGSLTGAGGTGDTLTSGAGGIDESLVAGTEQTNLTNLNTASGGTDVASQLSNVGPGSMGGDAQLIKASLPGGGAGGGTVLDAAAQGAGAAETASFGTRFMEGVKTAGSVVANKLTDPEALANLTMQAGAQVLGAALAPDPQMPLEQRKLLEIRKQELAELKQRDEAAFNAQMDAAKQFLQQAKQYDPTYMAFQAANKEAIDQQRKLREQQRKYALSGRRDLSEAEKRRMSLDAARNVSSQYDKGFQQGLTGQTKITQAGLSAIPNSAQFATYTDALNELTDDARQAETAMYSGTKGKNIADLFAGFNVDRGDVDEVIAEREAAKKKNKKKAGLNLNLGGGIAV